VLSAPTDNFRCPRRVYVMHRPMRGAVVEQRVIPTGVLAVLCVVGVVLFIALILWANQAG